MKRFYLKSHDTRVDTTTTFFLFYVLFCVQPRARFPKCDRPVFFCNLELESLFRNLETKRKQTTLLFLLFY
jgi:hypothetical protein